MMITGERGYLCLKCLNKLSQHGLILEHDCFEGVYRELTTKGTMIDDLPPQRARKWSCSEICRHEGRVRVWQKPISQRSICMCIFIFIYLYIYIYIIHFIIYIICLVVWNLLFLLIPNWDEHFSIDQHIFQGESSNHWSERCLRLAKVGCLEAAVGIYGSQVYHCSRETHQPTLVTRIMRWYRGVFNGPIAHLRRYWVMMGKQMQQLNGLVDGSPQVFSALVDCVRRCICIVVMIWLLWLIIVIIIVSSIMSIPHHLHTYNHT